MPLSQRAGRLRPARRITAPTDNRSDQGHGFCLTCRNNGQITLAADPVAGTACTTHLRDPGHQLATAAVDSVPVGWLGYAPGAVRPASTAPGPKRPRRRRPRRRNRPWAAIPDRVRERLQKRVRRPNGRFTPRFITAADIPAGVRVMLDPAAALEAFDTHPATSMWRCDRHRNWRAVWQALTYRIDWRTGGITTTHAQLSAAATDLLGESISVGTVRRVIAWARAADLLYVVEPGASAQVLGTDVNRAPTYAILAPMPVDELAHPPDPRSGDVTAVDGSLRNDGQDQQQEGVRRRSHPSQRPRQPFEMRRAPRSAAEQRDAAHTLRSIAGWSDIGDEQARRILARWFGAGWCLQALVHAIDQAPSGRRWPAPPPTAQQRDRWRYDADRTGRVRPHREATPARRRAAWLCWRLRHWLDPVTGQPLPPPIRAVELLERVVRPAAPKRLVPPSVSGPVLTGAGEDARAAARAIATQGRKSASANLRISVTEDY
ncbi:MAG: hypothetical protein JWO98_1510 [Frankiales bacterium]|nr:hypothetical protein [Frankiales bacterium]